MFEIVQWAFMEPETKILLMRANTNFYHELFHGEAYVCLMHKFVHMGKGYKVLDASYQIKGTGIIWAFAPETPASAISPYNFVFGYMKEGVHFS